MAMIVVFATAADTTSHQIIQWLYYYKANCLVVSEGNPIVRIRASLDNGHVPVFSATLKSGESFGNDAPHVYYYRNGLGFFGYRFAGLDTDELLKPFFANLKNEQQMFTSFLFEQIKSQTLGDFAASQPNKLTVLHEAQKAGLLIPATQVVNHTTLIEGHGLVNKNLSEIVSFNTPSQVIYNRTTRYKGHKKGPIFLSLLQQEVIKAFELRIFYLYGQCWAAAIFSQSYQKTVVDYRDITAKTNPVFVPYQLPKPVLANLKKLIKRLRYTTCSVDMLVDNKNRHWFLEINPVGQFGMVSTPCNYQLEKTIAQTLIKKHAQQKRTAQGHCRTYPPVTP
jgi:hypothetical protein